MAQNAVQVQIVRKLDRMERQIENVLKRVEGLEFELSYPPPESKMKKSYINKLKKIEKSVKTGHVIHYNSFIDFVKSVS